jgi:SpoVK/Ycf46/Vps4 family AAA+-type ATPase
MSTATPTPAPAPTATTAGKKTADDVQALIRARNPLLWIVTREEVRVERAVTEAAAEAKYELRFWDCAAGLTKIATDGKELGNHVEHAPGAGAKQPVAVLKAIAEQKTRAVWILRDFPAFLGDPGVLRSLRNLARSLPSEVRDEARTVVILTPHSKVPAELLGHAIVIDWPMPDRVEMTGILDAVLASLPPELAATAAQNGVRESAIDAALGLTAEEAASCYSKSLVLARRIDPRMVAAEKKRVIARERVLEWHDPDPRGLEAIGGLDLLKSWLTTRKAALSPRARAFGIPSPKGVLLVGVPGGGKSLTAKAVATAWGIPLLRLDLGALKSKWVGESEQNIRKALSVAENVAPCVLWIDEIEKALAGSQSESSGVSADALGSVLQWMQERIAPVFVVATANSVTSLPPELLRKGRFDELFFVDLPTRDERAAILIAALRGHGRDADQIDVARIATETPDFTGAELAALVPDALLAAFSDGERAITTGDLLEAIKGVVPLAKTAPEKITALRTWADGHARRASPGETKKGGGTRGALDM